MSKTNEINEIIECIKLIILKKNQLAQVRDDLYDELTDILDDVDQGVNNIEDGLHSIQSGLDQISQLL